MTLPVPLGVRFYQTNSGMDRYVTNWVDDVSFRSVIPGGFASASITLRVPRGGALSDPDPLGFSRLTELFNRIQITDLRSGEIAWEGRIEDPARQAEPDVWTIGALGSMVAASDIHRPVFYVDSSVESWNGEASIWFAGGGDGSPDGETIMENTTDSLARKCTSKVFNVVFDGAATYPVYTWRWASHGYDQPIARFTTTHKGTIPVSAQEVNFSLCVGIDANPTIDVSGFETSAVTKSNVIGTDFTDTNARFIVVGVRRDPGTGIYTLAKNTSDSLEVKFWNPAVVGQRQNRFGAKLVTAASYPADYVTVSQVVEDVVGRFLVGGWYELGLNTPWAGSVRPGDAYIDTSSTTQILHLTYPDGATAAQILTDMVDKVQPDAYWAIWESDWQANDQNDYGVRGGFRFEWATWPNNAGYYATSQDGFEGQPNGDDVYNFIFYRYPDSDDLNTSHVSTWWHGNDMAPELLTGAFTRAITINKEDPTTEATANTLTTDYLASKRKVLNAGTLTVRRPIYFHDAGIDSGSGAGRTVDPWMIRPGKLIRIVDVPPRGSINDLRTAPTAPSEALAGVVFRVVGTEYSSGDNSCRLELDQPERWQLSKQVVQGGSTRKALLVK